MSLRCRGYLSPRGEALEQRVTGSPFPNRCSAVSSQLLIAFPSRQGHLRLGEVLDSEGRAQLRRSLDDALAAGCVRLAVDGAHVRHVDQGAVADLRGAGAELRRRGGVLVVRAPSWAFTRVVETSGGRELLETDDVAWPEPVVEDERGAAEPVDLLGRLAQRAAQPRRPSRGRHRRVGSAPVLVVVGHRPR